MIILQLSSCCYSYSVVVVLVLLLCQLVGGGVPVSVVTSDTVDVMIGSNMLSVIALS